MICNEKTLEQDDLDLLGKIGVMYRFDFCLPPFNNSNNPFYSI